MLKKSMTYIITCLLVLSSVVQVSAAKVTDIKAMVNGFTVTVSATADRKGNYPLKVYETEDGKITGEPIYVGQTENAPAISESIVGEEENAYIQTFYTYSFLPFVLPESASTGIYHAVVGDTAFAAFTFVNKWDKINLYNEIAEASEDEVGNVLKQGAEKGLLPVDVSGYFSYDKEVQKLMDKEVAGLNLPALTEDSTEEEILSYETMLKNEIAYLLQVAELFSAEDFDEAVKNGDALELDMKFYGDKTLKLKPEAVKERLSDSYPKTFAKEDVQNAFSGAVLLAMIDTADYGSVTDALSYYDGKCITLDKTYTKDFDKVDFNTLSSELKKKADDIESISDLEDIYKDLAKAMTEDEEEEEKKPSSSGSVGGGGGGFSGGSNRGNATGAVDSNSVPKQPEKPVEIAVFTDLDSASWAKDAVTYIAGKGVINGKADGIFAPQDNVTREEFVKMLVEALSVLDKNATADFADVAKDRWSYPYIASGVAADLINGISETEFAPMANITRQDMAVIVHRGAKLLKLDLDKTVFFADEKEIAGYAKEAVSYLAGAGMINGVGENRFAPKDAVTRAQAAKIIYELVMANGGIK